MVRALRLSLAFLAHGFPSTPGTGTKKDIIPLAERRVLSYSYLRDDIFPVRITTAYLYERLKVSSGSNQTRSATLKPAKHVAPLRCKLSHGCHGMVSEGALT